MAKARERDGLIEAHVRCYLVRDLESPTPARSPPSGAVRVDADDDGSEDAPEPDAPKHLQYGAMRLSQPNDELGAMFLASLPTRVAHRIDAWSPLLPASFYDDDDGGAVGRFVRPNYPMPARRADDGDQGYTAKFSCPVCARRRPRTIPAT